MSAEEWHRKPTGADGEPLGPIKLPAPIEDFIRSKAQAMQDVVESHPSDLIERLLREMNELREFLDPLITDYVALLRVWKHSWEDIGKVLGVTRQSAWEKYRHVEGTLPRGVVGGERITT